MKEILVMNDWTKGWINEFYSCPTCNATSRGYSAPEIPLGDRCLGCGTEMEGFRLITKVAV
jgi:hypothetical protein